LCGFDLDLTKLTECVGVDWPEQGVGREIVLEVVERVVFLELFSRVLTQSVSQQSLTLLKLLTVPAFFKMIGAPPGCSDMKLVTSYAFESSTIQHDFLVLCFAISAPSMCPIFAVQRKPHRRCEREAIG
jgi:hypothetical protein